jgi:hypothetical protein
VEFAISSLFWRTSYLPSKKRHRGVSSPVKTIFIFSSSTSRDCRLRRTIHVFCVCIPCHSVEDYFLTPNNRAASTFLLSSGKPIVRSQLAPCSRITSLTSYHSSVDSCCSETFGSLLLATQFWDTYTGLEDKGQLLPPDAWNLHGLWPDFCNGSFTQYCDLKRQFDPSPSPNTTVSFLCTV